MKRDTHTLAYCYGLWGEHRRILERIKYRDDYYDHPIPKSLKVTINRRNERINKKDLNIEPDPLTLMTDIMLAGYYF